MFMFLHRNAGTVSRSVGLLGVVGLLSYLLIACAANPGTPSPSAVIPGATHSPARHLDCSTSSTTSNKTLFVLSDTLVLSSATPSSNEAKLAFVLRAFDQSGNKLWEQSLGQGASGGSYAAVQAANGHVYVSLYDGPEKNATQDNSQRSIIALDAGDGHQLWKVKEKEAMSTSFTTAPMQLCGDMLYLWSRNSIEARASENGQVVWHHTITELHLHSIQEVRATSKAVIVDGIGGPDQTQRCLDNNWCYLWYGDIVSALNSSNGGQLWQHPFIPDTHLEPGKPITYAQEGIAGIAVSEQAVYLNTAFMKKANEIEALALENGKQLWQRQALTDEHVFLHKLAVSNNIVYLQGMKLEAHKGSDGSLLWQKQDASLVLATEKALYLQVRDKPATIAPFCAYEPVTGTQQWCADIDSNTTALAYGDLVFTFTRQVNALRSRDGKLLWSYKLNTNNGTEVFLQGAALG